MLVNVPVETTSASTDLSEGRIQHLLGCFPTKRIKKNSGSTLSNSSNWTKTGLFNVAQPLKQVLRRRFFIFLQKFLRCFCCCFSQKLVNHSSLSFDERCKTVLFAACLVRCFATKDGMIKQESALSLLLFMRVEQLANLIRKLNYNG